MWRAAFGPMAENVSQLEDVSQADLFALLWQGSSKKPVPLRVANSPFDGLVKGVQELGKTAKVSREQRKKMRQQSASDLKSLNLRWLSEMINSEAQLREKMSLFWHGHFACRIINIYYQQQLLSVIRENALGNFRQLLREVSKTPAMLSFLNNQQNRKQHPNENFARELMELFTMGRGNYTETDVKEAARAFTGWGFNGQGEFVDRKPAHDNGIKNFLGRSGNFNGDDVIDIILEQKATAVFIVRKLYRFYVNEQVDEHHVQQLADSFYQDYDLGSLIKHLFTSAWFYDEKNIGSRIKSPVELLAGIRRLLPMQMSVPEMQLVFQRALGQVLFYPPNVAGWPGGKNWIDSSALMLRLRLPQILTSADEFSVQPKDDDDVMMGMKGDPMKKYLVETAVDWPAVIRAFDAIRRPDLLHKMKQVVLQTPNGVPDTILNRYIDEDSREAYIKTTLVYLMSSPEYQLC